MGDDSICPIQRKWQIGHSEVQLRCDLYRGHLTPKHRTSLNTDGIVINWEAK